MEVGSGRASGIARRRFIILAMALLVVHTFCMLFRYGQRPPAPVIGDEVTINDPAIALSRGMGLIAPSFQGSTFGLDKLYAHFPPIYIYLQALAFKLFGVSVYALRLTTTVSDILAAAAFLWVLYWLCERRRADWVTASLAAPLYTLNASVIALHRTARMEPLIECFCSLGLLCVFAGTAGGERRRGFGLIVLGCALAGLAMVTHPEALTAILPILLLVWLAPSMSAMRKSAATAACVIVPAVVWGLTYGSRTMEALRQMWELVRFTPGPGVIRFAQDFTREDHRNIGQGMRASLFIICGAVLVLTLVRWLRLEWRSRRWAQAIAARVTMRLYWARSFGIATVISVVLLVWFLGASITRYQVMFPVYLLGLTVILQGVDSQGRMARAGAVIACLVVAAEVIAVSVYLFRADVSPVDADPHRFDFIVQMIPKNEKVAATPMMWLAFQQQNRPMTLLYWRFDGRKNWARENGGDPLRQFDAIVIDESFIDDLKEDSPYAAVGRTEQSFVVGSDVVHLYLPRR